MAQQSQVFKGFMAHDMTNKAWWAQVRREIPTQTQDRSVAGAREPQMLTQFITAATNAHIKRRQRQPDT